MLLGPSGAVAAACGIRTAGEHQLASLRTPIMPCLRIKIVLIISSKYVFLIQWQHVASKLLVTRKESQAPTASLRTAIQDHAFASISSSKYSSFYPVAAAGIKTTVGIFEECNRRPLHPTWHQNIQRQHAVSKMLPSQGERGSKWHQ